MQRVIVKYQDLSNIKKLPLVGPLYFNSLKQVNERYILNEIVNKFFFAGDRFMPEIHLRQPRFTYSACGPFTKDKERQNLNKQEIHEIFIKTN